MQGWMPGEEGCEATKDHLYQVVLRYGADNEVRTRDLNLGKVALYQLSYVRIM